MQMVLGSADGAARMRLLKGIRTEAAAAGHAEVERAAADTIDALEKAEDASAAAARRIARASLALRSSWPSPVVLPTVPPLVPSERRAT